MLNAQDNMDRAAPEARYQVLLDHGVFALPACVRCDRAHYPPRVLCPHCGSDSIRLWKSPGRGVVYSTSMVTPRGAEPYAVVLVELDEGLLGMTRSAARELAPYNVIVNAVSPAAATPMTTTIRTDERFKDKYLESIPLDRWAEPDEIAGTYVFLGSDDASYLTAQVISVDGGRTMVR